MSVALRPLDGPAAALAVGGHWLAAAALALAMADLLTWLTVPSRRGTWAVRAPGRRWPPGYQLALLGAVLIAAALLRTPHRLVANLIGYAVVATALLWVAERRGGAPAARAAGLAVALFGFVPTHLNVGTPPTMETGAGGSAFIWTASWPSTEWVLRHEIELEKPLSRRAVLTLALAQRPTSRANVLVRLDGIELGPMRLAPYDVLEREVGLEHLAAKKHLVFELRLSDPDPSIRLLAHRWTGGASLGPAASSYFDGLRWNAGTFDDVLGRSRPGVYLLELQLR